MGLTWFQRIVGALMGYLGDPKAGNSVHFWFCWSELHKGTGGNWDHKEVLWSPSGHVRSLLFRYVSKKNQLNPITQS